MKILFEEICNLLAQENTMVSLEIKEELIAKLDEFATPSDTLEEVFENQEQTEISRFYERLPKPTLIAIQEMLDGEIYMREEIQKEDEIILEDGDSVLEEESGDEVEESDNPEEKTEKSAESDSANA